MRRALAALLLVAGAALGQETMDSAPCRMDGADCPGTYAGTPAPTGATANAVAVFLGSPLRLSYLTAGTAAQVLRVNAAGTALEFVTPGYEYTAATKTLAVPYGTVAASNLTATALPTPGAITVTPVLSQVGAITVVAGSLLADGDGLVVGDGVGTVPIEFDAAPGDGTTGGAIAIIFDGSESATEIRDAVKAILDGAGRDWTTSNQGADGIGLLRATPGATGGGIAEDVTDAGFLVTDWTDPTHATTVTYYLVGVAADGSLVGGGPASTTTLATATLSASNYLSLSWTLQTGWASARVYRTVAPTTPNTTGIVYSGTGTAVLDTGLAGGGETAPTTNGSGRFIGGVMTGATASVAGVAGTVPAPAAGDEAKALKGDGTWGSAGITNAAGANVVPKADAGGNLVASNLSDSGTAVTSAVPVWFPDGTAAAPAFVWGNDAGQNSGIYRVAGTNSTSFTFDGAIKAGVSSGGYYGVTSTGGVFWNAASNDVTGGTIDLILTRGAAATFQRGAAASATPVAQFATTQSGAGTNIAGQDDVRTTSLGTGSATSGSTVERTGYPGASGTTAATPSSRSRLSGKWTPLTAGVATAFLDIAVPVSGVATGEVYVLVEANDGTEYQGLGSRVRWTSAAKATGNPACTVNVVGTDLPAYTSGASLTAAYTVAAAAGKCTVLADAASDLTETTLRANVQVIGNGPGVTFTPLP